MTSIIMSKAARRKAAVVAGSGAALTMIATTSSASLAPTQATIPAVDVSVTTDNATKTISANKAVVATDTQWAPPEESAPAEVKITEPKVNPNVAGKASAHKYGNYPENPKGGILDVASQYVGVPYVFGGGSPKGFDCSGFVSYVYRHSAGVNLPHGSGQIGAMGHRIPASQAKPGDVLHWPGHVAIYAGNGKIIHANWGTGVTFANVYGNPTYHRF
ncbi:MAG: NlpC/P60 family protein [Actinomycetaceae bacterium]|nr:NlpC/P60 family protein [Actinomycetaceae bacterium]MDO5746989.1 NlpC/P60 family protein [Actinomycetaceae bacterium]